jgi:uncharacterized protein YrrD
VTGLRAALGRPVITRDTAETVGDVQGAVVDVPTRRVVAFQIGKGRKARVVDWASLSAVGPDAVVVQSESALREPTGEREERFLKGDLSLLGARVLTDRGDVAGSLDDVEFDETSGLLVALVAGERRFPATGLHAIGSFAVVVTAEDGGSETTAPTAT